MTNTRHIRCFRIDPDLLVRLLTPTVEGGYLTIEGESLPDDAEIIAITTGNASAFDVESVDIVVYSATFPAVRGRVMIERPSVRVVEHETALVPI